MYVGDVDSWANGEIGDGARGAWCVVLSGAKKVPLVEDGEDGWMDG